MFDYPEDFIYSRDEIDPDRPGIWRYEHSFGFRQGLRPISLGEGRTPLIEDRVNNHTVYFKLEFLNPTGSFKDRGSSTLMSFISDRGTQEAVEDSSGNAGASFAAYTARAGILGRVFIPDTASGPKQKQIEAFGAEIVRVLGPRSNAEVAVIKVVTTEVVYASHAYLPFGISGYATLAYEIFEQLNGDPGSIICPVGQGGLLLGIYRGFKALKNANLIKKIPKLFGVQAQACAPLWAIAEYGPAGLTWVSGGYTIAEGIHVAHPVRGDAVLAAVEDSHGNFMIVDEEAILPARDEIAQRGFYVEPTSAVVWPVLIKFIESLPEPIVIILTGSGLKYSSDS